MLPLLRRETAPNASKDWWAGAFTPDERAAIEEAFKPLGNISAESLARSTDPGTIGNLVGHLKKETLRHLGYKLLERADSLVSENVPVLSMHFYFSARGDFFYRWRNLDPFALNEAVTSYQRQIGMAANAAKAFREGKDWGFVPAHAGYRQLRIIEEKQGNLTMARALCEQAKAEGWTDDWEHHIARIDSKLARGC